MFSGGIERDQLHYWINHYQGKGLIHLVCTQNFPKTNISCPLIRTHTRAYQGEGWGGGGVRYVSFSENFA